jgi:hypothetical protein
MAPTTFFATNPDLHVWRGDRCGHVFVGVV